MYTTKILDEIWTLKCRGNLYGSLNFIKGLLLNRCPFELNFILNHLFKGFNYFIKIKNKSSHEINFPTKQLHILFSIWRWGIHDGFGVFQFNVNPILRNDIP
jgi:hypothetical protein